VVARLARRNRGGGAVLISDTILSGEGRLFPPPFVPGFLRCGYARACIRFRNLHPDAC
jgi:hypothetical protein